MKLKQAVALVLLALVPAIGQAIYFRDQVPWRKPVLPSEMVNLAQARAWGDNAIWLDARPDAEFAQDHIPGAIQLNEDRWNELLPQFLMVWSAEKKIVVYCSSESCNASREIAHRLRHEAQMKDVFVLEGGWEEWLKARP